MVSFISVDSHNAVNLTVLLACMGHQSVALIKEIKLSAMDLCLIKKTHYVFPQISFENEFCVERL